MRITPEILRKIARDSVAQRTRSDRDLLAVYLVGSLLEDDPLIGGTTDIDLFFIHNDDIQQAREIVRLTEEVHLDITHHSRYLYHQPRELRLHPWMGSTIYGCKILYDPRHFMDFTMASVCGQFYQPDNILKRAQPQAEDARQTWLSFQLEPREPTPVDLAHYLTAVENSANAIACLSGSPLPERRLLLQFTERAQAAGHGGMYKGLLGLLGAPRVDAEVVRAWIPQWRGAILSLPQGNAFPRLHPHRMAYYQRAFDSILSGPDPMAVLWPLLHTWILAIQALPEDAPAVRDWQEAMGQLGLLGSDFSERVAALDAFLDTVEETLENWAQANGVA